MFKSIGRYGVLAGLIIVALAAISIPLGSFYTIDERERGVVLRNGAVKEVAKPGLHFKLPWIDSVMKMSVETKLFRWDRLPAYSKDQQTATITVSASVRVAESNVDEVYSLYGDLESMVRRVLSPKVNEEMKVVFGQFNAVTAIQDRGRLNAEVRAAIMRAVEKAPIIIETVQIEDIDFSDAYEKSIEQRMLAEVEVQKVKQNSEREKVTAEITVIKAKAEADAALARAKAEADAIRIKGEAEASAINARGKALRDNPNLVDLVAAEKWNGALPTTMVPGSSVPFMNVGK